MANVTCPVETYFRSAWQIEINLGDPLTISTIIEESPCEGSARSVRARGAGGSDWERGGVHVDTKAVYTCCRGRGLGK